MPSGDPPNLDLLQNIEQVIVIVYRQHSDLPDYDVDDALVALIDDYRRDENHPPKEHRLKGHSREIYEGVKVICDWRLGRGETLEEQFNTPEEIIAALRKIRKSVERWTKQGGRQGYLRFISSMMP